MTFFRDLFGALAFRPRSLRALGARRSAGRAIVCLAAGLVTYVLVRYSVHSEAMASPYLEAPPTLLETFLDINLLQTIVFLTMIYIPSVIALSNAFAGDGLGFTVSRSEYTICLSTMGPLWGALFLFAAPIQWAFPRPPDFGLLWLTASVAIYTVWAIKESAYISFVAALAVFVLSWFTLPVFFLLTNFLLALPLFIIIPLLYIFIQRFRELISLRSSLSDFRRHLHALTLNPRHADAHFQLGLLHFRNAHLDAAQGYFEQALSIDPQDPDYHYYLGRVFEQREDWLKAVDAYEATYRLNPEYGLGDIFREVGKAYLHTGQLEKASEFLSYFLQRRGSDPEGRYWLAIALQQAGKTSEMRNQLKTILDQARSNPRFFRKENRKWIYQARTLLRSTS